MLCVLFLAGMAIDIGHVVMVRAQTGGKASIASILAGALTFGSLQVWGIVLTDALTGGVFPALVFSLGAVLGTWIGCRLRISRE